MNRKFLCLLVVLSKFNEIVLENSTTANTFGDESSYSETYRRFLFYVLPGKYL